jgi:hypothetical protein
VQSRCLPVLGIGLVAAAHVVALPLMNTAMASPPALVLYAAIAGLILFLALSNVMDPGIVLPHHADVGHAPAPHVEPPPVRSAADPPLRDRPVVVDVDMAMDQAATLPLIGRPAAPAKALPPHLTARLTVRTSVRRWGSVWGAHPPRSGRGSSSRQRRLNGA